MVIMRETPPERSPPRKMDQKGTPWKIFQLLVQVFSSNLHKSLHIKTGIFTTNMMYL